MRNALLALTSTVLSLYAIQFAIPRPPPQIPWTAVYEPGLLPAVYPSEFILSPLEIDGQSVQPLASVPNSKLILCDESGPWEVIQTDQFGFRNAPKNWKADTVFVGDSFTLGACVPTGTRFVDIFGGLALGFTDNGPLIQLATIVEYAFHGKPKTVVWVYYAGNDLRDLARERQSPILLNYLRPGFTQNLVSKADAVAEAMTKIADDKITSPEHPTPKRFDFPALLDFLKLGSIRGYLLHTFSINTFTGLHDKPSDQIDLFAQVIARARSEAESHGAKFAFVYIPARTSIATFGHDDINRQAVLKIAGPDAIDLTDFLASIPRHNFPNHFSVEGNRAVGEHLKALLN